MQSELTQKFQSVVKQVFGKALAPFGFSDGVNTPYGVRFSRFNLEISFEHECREPDLVLPLCSIRPKRFGLPGGTFSLETIAEYREVDWERWKVPVAVSDPAKMEAAMVQLREALLGVCEPILKGDFSVLRRKMQRAAEERARVRRVIQTLYDEAYGAWLDKDYSKLLALYARLEGLGYTLNEVQRERASVARRAISNA